MSSLGALWTTLHPAARFLMGSGKQPNTAGPRWTQTGPGRYEMEGGVPPSMQAEPPAPRGNLPMQTGGPGQVSGNLFPGLTGGGGQMQQMPGLPPMQTGGGMQQMGGFNGMTGGPGQQMGGFPGMTGGGMQRQSAFAPYGADEADPYGGGFRGNFGMGVFR